MSDTNNYSARHWAAKAKRYAEQAAGGHPVLFSTTEEALAGLSEDTAMSPYTTKQVVSESIGRGIQLGFNGTLSGDTLTFEVPSESYGPYSIKDFYDYEIDLLFSAVGSLADSTKMVIVNNNETYQIVNVLHDDFTTPVTVGDMKQIMKYNTETGFRWVFYARATTTTTGVKVFVMPSTVSLQQGVQTDTDNVFTGVQTFKGDNHPVRIEGMAGTTATGLQIKDTLSSSETDFEHYRNGDMYGLKIRVENDQSVSKNILNGYVSDAGKSIVDFTDNDGVKVPAVDDTSSSDSAVPINYLTTSQNLKAFYSAQSDLSASYVEYSTSIADGTSLTMDYSGKLSVTGTSSGTGDYISLTNTTLNMPSVQIATQGGQGLSVLLDVSQGDSVSLGYGGVTLTSIKCFKKKGVA